MAPRQPRGKEPDRFYTETQYPFGSTTSSGGAVSVPDRAYAKGKVAPRELSLSDRLHEIGSQFSAQRDKAVNAVSDYYGKTIDPRGAATIEDVAKDRAWSQGEPDIISQLFPREAAMAQMRAGQQGTGLAPLLWAGAKDLGSLPGRAAYALAAGGMDHIERGKEAAAESVGRVMADPTGGDILESATKDPLAALSAGLLGAGRYALSTASEMPGLVRAAQAAYQGLSRPEAKILAAAGAGAGLDLGYQAANKYGALRPDEVSISPASTLISGGMAGLGAANRQAAARGAADRLERYVVGKDEVGIPPQSARDYITDGLQTGRLRDPSQFHEGADLELAKAESRMANYAANKAYLDQHLLTPDENARDAAWRQARTMEGRHAAHSNDMPEGYHDNDNGTGNYLSPATIDRLMAWEPDGMRRVTRIAGFPTITGKVNKEIKNYYAAQDATRLAPVLGALLSSFAR